MNLRDDYLWNPEATPDADIERIERALAPLGARALKLDERELRLKKRAPWRYVAAIAAGIASVFLGLYAVHTYRLSWDENRAWSVATTQADGAVRQWELSVGEPLITGPDEAAQLSAARIGTVTVAPNSLARVTRTRKGLHRVELERGRLHARIWAPPNHFGVTHGDMRFTDLGCEFDLEIDASSAGTLHVTSGWVIYRIRGEEVLVPEQYVLAFDETTVRVPLRSDAAAEFRRWVIELDTMAPTNDRARIFELSQGIAANARDADYFTLLSLLVRHPTLAEAPLYTRLAAALNIDVDESHRARWMQGDATARDEWWRRIPEQPKTWWLKWRDALPQL